MSKVPTGNYHPIYISVWAMKLMEGTGCLGRNFVYSCQGSSYSDFKLIEIHNFASFQYFLFNLVGRHTVV